MAEGAVAAAQYSDQLWRLNNLFAIVDKEGQHCPFRLNWAQQAVFDAMHYLNVILKCRQLGFSTFIDLYILDTCLFNPNVRAGVIAHSKDDAQELFRTKIKYPYEHLPDQLQGGWFEQSDRKDELVLDNGSSIRVSTSMRSGTAQILHVSEYGKISKKYPDKAREIKTGAFEAVAAGQMIFVESTAEGRQGEFFELTARARNMGLSKAPLTRLDFKFFFFPWWKHPEYQLTREEALATPITQRLADYFKQLLDNHGIELSRGQKAWYIKKEATLGWDVKREHPSCVHGATLIPTRQGLVPISTASADGRMVLAHLSQGIKPVWRLRTALGYEVTLTADHRIRTPDGFREVRDLRVGDPVCLGSYALQGSPQVVTFSPLPCVTSQITIDADFARFLGYFVSDGSYHDRTLSIVCTAEDTDVVADVLGLVTRFFAPAATRPSGSRQGGTEVRVGCTRAREVLMALGVLRTNSSDQFKRRICVPDCIRRSPPEVVTEFLRGFFEGDGFVTRDGSTVKAFAKDGAFLRDVQLLLLGFGITSRLVAREKKAGSGHLYTGHEISLRRAETLQFGAQINFVSQRKRGRALNGRPAAYHAKLIDFLTTVASIAPAGEAPVYDITTQDQQFIAGGIVVHNCPDEAFEASVEGAYFAPQMQKARAERRICKVPHQDGVAVDTWWDLGMSDYTAIWFTQNVGREVHVIEYYEACGEGFAHYAAMLSVRRDELGYHYGRHVGPHDLAVRELGPGKSRIESARGYGIKFELATRCEAKADDIEAARNILGVCWFDEERCDTGITRLDNYKKEWDDRLGRWKDSPRHDENCHGADAFQTLAKQHHRISHKGKARAASTPPPRGAWT